MKGDGRIGGRRVEDNPDKRRPARLEPMFRSMVDDGCRSAVERGGDSHRQDGCGMPATWSGVQLPAEFRQGGNRLGGGKLAVIASAHAIGHTKHPRFGEAPEGILVVYPHKAKIAPGRMMEMFKGMHGETSSIKCVIFPRRHRADAADRQTPGQEADARTAPSTRTARRPFRDRARCPKAQPPRVRPEPSPPHP